MKKQKKKTKVIYICDILLKNKLSKKKFLKKSVEIGDYIYFEGKSKITGKFIQGRALDDRSGCFVLVELAKKLKKVRNEIYFVFTTQEEIGLYGAKTSAFKIDPDWAIAVDVSDTKDISKTRESMGNVPIITIKDEEFIANKCINSWLKSNSKEQQIPVQYVVSDEGTTDARNISLSKGGVPTALVGVVVKDVHKPRGTANIDDIQNLIKLVYELMKNPPKTCSV